MTAGATEGADVAIVVPCFNAEQFISEALTSALAQDAVLEVIVVDDGSTDRSAAVVGTIAERDPRVKLHRGPNCGSASARNKGVRLVSPASLYVLFLDADDVLAPGAVSSLRARLEREPRLGAVMGSRSRVDPAGALIEPAPAAIPFYYAEEHRVRRVDVVDRVGYWHVLPICPISTPGQCLIRVSELPSGDVFDRRFAPCEDWDLWLRLSRRRDIGVENREVLSYRDHQTNISKQYHLMYDQRGAVYRAQLEVVAPSERERLRTAWRFGMFKFDAGICFDWARARLAARDVLGSARYLQRALRWEARYLWAVAHKSPNMDRVLARAD